MKSPHRVPDRSGTAVEPMAREVLARPGDFQRADAGSVHVPQSTPDGCLLLVTSSLEDELLH